MKKANLIMILVLSVVGAFAQASNPDCPLKNLKKNQLRGDNSTAFYPGKQRTRQDVLNNKEVYRNN